MAYLRRIDRTQAASEETHIAARYERSNAKSEEMKPQSTISPYKQKGYAYHPVITDIRQNKRSGKLNARSTIAVRRPEGMRFYEGHGEDEPTEQGESRSAAAAEISAVNRSRTAPADSVRSHVVKKRVKPDHFKRLKELLYNAPSYFRTNKS